MRSACSGGTSLPRSLSPWLLLCFAPLWDNLYAGQINTFVLLAIAAAWLLSIRGRQVGAGAALAVAVVLKSLPALLLVYFVAVRQWRAVVSCLAVALVASAAAAVVWRAEYLRTWIDVSMATVSTDFDYMNLGVRAAAMRWFGDGAGKVVHALLFVAACGFACWRRAKFERLVVVMTTFGPVVWYHHMVFLLLPIVAAIAVAPWRAWIAVALIQFERPFADHVPALAAAPCLVAATLLYFVPYERGLVHLTARASAVPAAA